MLEVVDDNPDMNENFDGDDTVGSNDDSGFVKSPSIISCISYNGNVSKTKIMVNVIKNALMNQSYIVFEKYRGVVFILLVSTFGLVLLRSYS